jgi:hypothetical protein
MSETFQELQKKLTSAKNRKTIILQLIEYVDTNFCPVAGKEPALKLLSDDRIPVPVEDFESFVADILTSEVQALDQEITRILDTALDEKVEKKTKKATQGDAK